MSCEDNLDSSIDNSFDKIIEYVRILPYKTIELITKNLYDHHMRRLFNFKLSWSIPSEYAVDCIIKFINKHGSALEVGAGHGLWAFLIKKGANIIATDSNISHGSTSKNKFIEVVEMDHKTAIATYPTEVLFMSWPSYDDKFAAESLRVFLGKYLIYIGEDVGGCTADDEFFEIIGDEWELIQCIDIPQWNGIHDTLNFYERK
jgi:hypothetical protein